MPKRFTHEGVTFVFDDAGRGAPVVLLHGLGGDRRGALQLLDDQEELWRRLALDQRGHGDTAPLGPPSALTFPHLAADVRALLDHEGIDRAAIAGVSMGAAVALRFALDHPDRVTKLALVRPAWLHAPLAPSLLPYVEIAKLLSRFDPEQAVVQLHTYDWFEEIARDSQHAGSTLESQILQPRAAERAHRLDRLPRSTPYGAPTDLGDVPSRTLVIGCEHDPLHPFYMAEELARLIPFAKFQQVPSSNSDVAQHRQAVRAAIGSFLRNDD